MPHGYPRATPGQAVGLLGGSFDPAHAGHRHITLWALRTLGLDRVWWLVSPGNPLKARGPAPLARRVAAAERVMRHPRVDVTGIEARLGSRFTADTVASLQRRYPGVRFVWLMGSDNMAGFHAWERWRWIMENVAVGVLARPGGQLKAGLSPAAEAYRRHRLPQGRARLLRTADPPCWVLLTGPMLSHSSSEIRRRGAWP
ncbi:MAG TPA: nicotinate-nucleotide adenylyltransferase [Thermohalobaculum sp.]|nr:nicotinate-nucleotide adenylyltransferase [Thermohalobaculum sp.]